MTIDDLIGLGVGRLGLGYREVLLLRPDEFEAIARHRNEHLQALDHAEWERTRLLATMLLQPHSTRTLNARTLLPFPWDTDTPARHSAQARRSTPEAFKAAIQAAEINNRPTPRE